MDRLFRSLAKRIHLTPNEGVLEDCARFVQESRGDVDLLKSIDTDGVSILPSAQSITINYDDLIGFASVDCENEHLVKALVRNYVISDIKKPS